MPVSNDIFLPLSELYYSYETSADQDKFLTKNRKKIKVLADSIWEQTVESIFSVKPRNHTDARKIINKRKCELTLPDDLAVVEALLEVLREYEVLVDKSYIDLARKLRPVFVISLRKLCVNLTLHKDHKTTDPAIKLRTLLSKV